MPDCDLANPAKNGECGAMANQNFGKNVFSRTYDPALVNGWGVRPYNWEMGASVQQEVVPRVSVNVGYYRRWFGNFYVTDNRAVGPSDLRSVQLPVAADPRLPDGGGQTITDLYDLKPDEVRAGGQLPRPARATSGSRSRTGTAWTSPSTRGCGTGSRCRAARAPGAG